MGMLRFYYVALSSPLFVTKMVFRCKRVNKHPEEYTEEERYRMAQRIMDHMRRRGRATTKVYGLENLPKEGGYIMYSNHQGKYDALGILLNHKEPCSVLMEKNQSEKIVAKQVIDLVGGKRLDFKNPRQMLATLGELAAEVKAGKRYLIFPEGRWADNKNTLLPFNSGCFRCSLESRTPIVPVVLIDSYKALNGNSFKKAVTYIYFLPTIPYEDYKDMKKTEISAMVKERIQKKIDFELAVRRQNAREKNNG